MTITGRFWVTPEALTVSVGDSFFPGRTGTATAVIPKGSAGSVTLSAAASSEDSGIPNIAVSLNSGCYGFMGTCIFGGPKAKYTVLSGTVTCSTCSVCTLKKVSGDEQVGLVSQKLSRPLTVQVVDENDRPIKDRTVLFDVSDNSSDSDGAMIKPDDVTTNKDGNASTVLTLGDKQGLYYVIAEARGCTPLVTFTATAGPCSARTVNTAPACSSPVLFGGYGIDPSTDREAARTEISTVRPTVATVPLGSTFYFQVRRNNGTTPVPYRVELVGHSVTGVTKIEPLLFPDTVVLSLRSGHDPEIRVPDSAVEHFFYAVHLGNVRLLFIPTIPAADTFGFEVDLRVTASATLGRTYNDIDPLLLKYSNVRGIPPDLVKGQVEKESTFNPFSYRYEPRYDRQNIQPKLNSAAYRNYRLDDGPLLSRPADISPREKYRICPPSAPTKTDGRCKARTDIRNIIASDTDITARNLILHNKGMGPTPSSSYLFRAQTTIASSYGYLQTMWATRLCQLGNCNNGSPLPYLNQPAVAFDSPDNLALEASSIPIGTAYLVKKFLRINGEASPNVSSRVQLMELFRAPLHRYNGTNDNAAAYATKVLSNARAYVATPQTKMF